VRSAAPTIGEHTDGLLAELGYSTTEIAALHAGGVIAAASNAGGPFGVDSDNACQGRQR